LIEQSILNIQINPRVVHQDRRYNRTALHGAVFNNHPAIVSQLLSDDKMDASLKDRLNRTALKYAIDREHMNTPSV
jgi:ankyrin repeat protein